MLRDTTVLVSSTFYYFGRDALEVPEEFRPRIPKGQAGNGVWTDDERATVFINWVRQNYQQGVNASPHRWDDNDDSWRNW
jgi:hypothetical protein